MTKRLWFRAKRYGWGWEPATWQGWAVMLVWSALVVVGFVIVDSHAASTSAMLLIAIPNTIILSAMLVVVCYCTGETPRWRWGGK